MPKEATKYDENYNEQAYKLCLLGATDKDLADFFNVCEATINNWKLEHPTFLESLKMGKQTADANVAMSLYKRATGYDAPDVDIKVIENQIVKTPLIKHYPPDPTSMIFWLKNRRSKDWKDKQEIEQTHHIEDMKSNQSQIFKSDTGEGVSDS